MNIGWDMLAFSLEPPSWTPSWKKYLSPANISRDFFWSIRRSNTTQIRWNRPGSNLFPPYHCAGARFTRLKTKQNRGMHYFIYFQSTWGFSTSQAMNPWKLIKVPHIHWGKLAGYFDRCTRTAKIRSSQMSVEKGNFSCNRFELMWSTNHAVERCHDGHVVTVVSMIPWPSSEVMTSEIFRVLTAQTANVDGLGNYDEDAKVSIPDNNNTLGCGQELEKNRDKVRLQNWKISKASYKVAIQRHDGDPIVALIRVARKQTGS